MTVDSTGQSECLWCKRSLNTWGFLVMFCLKKTIDGVVKPPTRPIVMTITCRNCLLC